MQTIIPADHCLIKRSQVKYLSEPRPATTVGNVRPVDQTKEEIIQEQQFAIHIRREGGVILGLQVVHNSGDEVKIDFRY